MNIEPAICNGYLPLFTEMVLEGGDGVGGWCSKKRRRSRRGEELKGS